MLALYDIALARVANQRAAFAVDVRAAVWSEGKQFSKYLNTLDP